MSLEFPFFSFSNQKCHLISLLFPLKDIFIYSSSLFLSENYLVLSYLYEKFKKMNDVSKLSHEDISLIGALINSLKKIELN